MNWWTFHWRSPGLSYVQTSSSCLYTMHSTNAACSTSAPTQDPWPARSLLAHSTLALVAHSTHMATAQSYTLTGAGVTIRIFSNRTTPADTSTCPKTLFIQLQSIKHKATHSCRTQELFIGRSYYTPIQHGRRPPLLLRQWHSRSRFNQVLFFQHSTLKGQRREQWPQPPCRTSP